MKKVIYLFVLALIVVSGLLYANRKIETAVVVAPKPLSSEVKKASLLAWEATPDGKMYKEWEASPAGKKVQASVSKIEKSIKEFTNMEGMVTSLSLPPGSRLGIGVMVKINGEDYILAFGQEKPGSSIVNYNNVFEQLHILNVNDKLIIRSHFVSQAPKYAYPIINVDYVERDGKVFFERPIGEGGC